MTAETPISSPRRTAVWTVLPVAVAMALFVLLLATREPGVDRDKESSLAGELAPAIVAPTTAGSTFDLDALRGRFVVVNFFSTTCIPCIVEHPELVEFHETHEPTGFAEVVSIAFDDGADNVRNFFSENGGEWPVIVADTGPLAVSYGVTAVPESIVVADTGEVVRKLIGGVTKEGLESVIAGFLEERQAA